MALSTRKLITSALRCLEILALQGAAFPFLYTFFAKYHKESFFIRLSAFPLRLFGVQSGFVNGYTLRLDAAFSPVDFVSTYEKSGIFFIALIFIGALALLKPGVTNYVRLFFTCFAYIVLRYTALMLVYCQYQIHGIFWERVATLASLLPLAPALSLICASRAMHGHGINPVHISCIAYLRKAFRASHALNCISMASAALLAFSGVAFFGLHDPGVKKAGRVVVDEYHSNWEWTDEAYDENWFGERSGYNYYCFYEYINKFYDASRNTAPITSQALSNADVLILKTPTEPYSAAEIRAVLDFVGGGGGLYLIGDHTNVFGTGANLNKLAANFGLRFQYDCTYELTDGNLSEYDAPKLMPHPVVSSLPHFLFATSDTLDTPLLAEDVILGYGLKNLPADYSQRNFFPEDTNTGKVEFGAFVQSAAVPYKKGRVLAFTDSTVFSNFWMHMRGKPELLLGSLDWLNHKNMFPAAPRAISLAIMIISALALAIAFIRAPAAVQTAALSAVPSSAPSAALSAALSAAFSCIFSVVLFAALAHSARLPAPIRPIEYARFEQEYSDMDLPINLKGFLANMDRQMSTFYVWTQRLGYVPTLSASLREALAAAASERGIVVIAKPNKPLTNIRDVLKQVDNGAILLILDNVESGAHSNELLRLAGMEIADADIQGSAEYGGSLVSGITPTSKASALNKISQFDFSSEAGQMRDSNGNLLYGAIDIGLGKLAVFTDPDLFYNLELGDVSANLTEKTALLTRLEFEIIKNLRYNDD